MTHMSNPSFGGLRVLAFESRRRAEIAALVTAYGGTPISAPAMREVPLESNEAAKAFIEAFVRDEFDVLIALTGVGLRAVLDLAALSVGREAFVAALGRARIVARGPKPLAVLREIGIAPWVLAPEPNTWRELLGAMDARGRDALSGLRVAVQEYGVSSLPLVEGLQERGAHVTRVPIYRYGLPEDIEPLREAVRLIARGDIDVVLFTTATQVTHLLDVTAAMGLDAAVRAGLTGLVIASIGPTTGEALRAHGVAIDIEASHPKMGVLVRDAAAGARALLDARRSSGR